MVFCSSYTLPPSGEKETGGGGVVATIDCNLDGKDLCCEYQQCIFGAREVAAWAVSAAAAAKGSTRRLFALFDLEILFKKG